MADYNGKYIGRYHIREQLGEGGMAVVYRAFDTNLERDVAIKFIRTGQIVPDMLDQMMKRFEREAKALARFDHPNIIGVYEYGVYESTPYLVMQYQPGGTLRDKTGQPMDCREAVGLILKLTEALSYAHEFQVIHRDIKPANILLTHKGEPKITDFGIAKILDMNQSTILTRTGVGIGTPEYMAPEQFLGKNIDGRADIYALGVVLYELVTGRRPYQADTPAAVMIKQTTEALPSPLEFNPLVGEELENVIVKALAKEPEHRYQRMNEFGEALKGLLHGNKSSPAPVLPTEIYEKTEKAIQKDSLPGDIISEINELADKTEPEDIGMKEPLSEELVFETQPDLIAASREEQPQIEIVEEGLAAVPKRRISKRAWGIGAALVAGIILIGIVVSLIGKGLEGEGLLAGLASPTVTQTSTATATHTPEDTSTPTMTNTPEETATPPNTATPEFRIGSTMISEKDGMQLMYVPAGTFEMGSNYGLGDEHPIHTVFLDAFWIDQTEISNTMFSKFVNSSGYVTDAENKGWSYELGEGRLNRIEKMDWKAPQGPGSDAMEDRPVIHVSWNDAAAFCEWAGRRLPTEAEWEKAARGTDERTYPWGEDTDSNRANYDGSLGDITGVGNHPQGASPYGALDMAGNVWEWVADWYDEDYYSNSLFENPQGSAIGEFRVFRGGSWNFNFQNVRSSIRGKWSPDKSYYGIGFRCALSSP
ncbi:MAG: SUMF1/EgtB/PvdO family nonheme iron enzyme [Anaerolineaceae bacterium]|nr:SUMF1/EgtB/PvdO family nonheme iron enzyme [Anaerolineaceae bacterium]